MCICLTAIHPHHKAPRRIFLAFLRQNRQLQKAMSFPINIKNFSQYYHISRGIMFFEKSKAIPILQSG
jgi:hypothetical protein